MRVFDFPHFRMAAEQIKLGLQHKSNLVHSARWQGADIVNRPEMATHEVTHVHFGVPLNGVEDLEHYRKDIAPNLPWADDHFLERVGGAPINPGEEWRNWPYGKSAESFLDNKGQFNHNYMERYWPKYAGKLDFPTYDPPSYDLHLRNEGILPHEAHHGIRYQYGDLNDVVKLLAEDPYTRQAYLPIWFPEDTGGGSKRAPCTIGYHFLMRDGKLDVSYQIRSCDFVRHFRDDCYLTVRLLLWVLDRVREINGQFGEVRPGRYVMAIQSLHIFRNDYLMLFGKQ